MILCCRGPRHANEYSSISKGNGAAVLFYSVLFCRLLLYNNQQKGRVSLWDKTSLTFITTLPPLPPHTGDEHQGRGAGGPGPGPGPGFQGSYQRDEEGGHGSSARKHPVLALTSPSNGQAEGNAGNTTAVRQSQRNSPFLHQGYFSNPSQEGNGPRTVSKYSEGDTQQYRQQNHLPPYDTEYDTENGVESQERRGRGPRRSGMTGRGISIDSTMSCYSDTSSVTVRDDCYSSNLPSIDSDLSTLHNNHSSTQELQSGRGGIGLLIYDPDRKWGSWLGL